MANKDGRGNAAPHRYSQRELEVFASVHRTHVVAQALTRVARYTCYVLITGLAAWCVVHSLDAVAGKITLADIRASVAWSSDKHEDNLAAYVKLARLIYEIVAPIFGLVGFWYGRRTRRREDDTIIQFAPFRQMHEVALDANRTSSGLGRDGSTPPEERS